MSDQHDDDLDWDPLASGAASLPPVLGAGCASRFDPGSLNDASGADFSAVEKPLEQGPDRSEH